MRDQCPRFVIEVPRGGRVKRRRDGTIAFVSPLGCPFNYGSLEGTLGEDGDPVDVVVLGPRLAVGACGELPIRARVHFVDVGIADPKYVVSAEPLSLADERRIRRFFRVYALTKAFAARILGRSGPTRFVRLEPIAADRDVRWLPTTPGAEV